MTDTPASDLIRAAEPVAMNPWPRHVMTQPAWRAMAAALAREPGLSLQGLWADTMQVHALFQAGDGTPLLASVPAEGGFYDALSPHRPAAAWFERAVADLWGHRAADGTDVRPWLDWGRWPALHPMSARPVPNAGQPEPPEFLPAESTVEGEDLHQLPLGPVHAGIAEPSHVRLSCAGETVVRLETRLGYAHKGTLTLMRGKPPRAAARFAARLSGDSTVAHQVAFARAVEAALGMAVPPRAHALRGAMAELERLAHHLAALGAACAAAGFAPLPARLGLHQDAVLRATAAAFGRRVMMDCVLPGGVAADLPADGEAPVLRALDRLERELPELRAAYGDTASLAERVAGTGRIPPGFIARFAPGGPLGRAAGHAVDARRAPGYPPYESLPFEPPLLRGGDVDARLRLFLAEIEQAMSLLRVLLPNLPAGPHAVPLPESGGGEGLAVTEGPRGPCWHWVRLDHGQVAAAYARDPAWLHWPLLEAAMAGGAVDDLPLVAASFASSVSGADL